MAGLGATVSRAAHEVAGVREAIAAAGASVLHLPLHSPDPNPIEPLFATLKALLGTVGAKAASWDVAGVLSDGCAPSEHRPYLLTQAVTASNPEML